METTATATSISQGLRGEKGNLQEIFFFSSCLAGESHDSVIQPGCEPASNKAADPEQLLEQHLSLSETLETSNT